MYTEDDLLPLSGLQHLVYCERQAALIHLEHVWAENRFTAEGEVLHERVDEAPGETRGDLRIARGIALRSLRLGLSGRADVVEFHREPGGASRVVPVEYKRGRPKLHDADRVQLCAQALCLEEMLGVEILEGAIFYGQPRRREVVPFDTALRERTEAAARRFRQLLAEQLTPAPVNDARCDACSLRDACLPGTRGHSARRYLAGALRRSLDEAEP